MSITVKELAKKNIAKRLGVSNYANLVCAGVEEEKAIVAKASKKMGHRKIKLHNYASSGNPYVMLGFKINTKGKRTK